MGLGEVEGGAVVRDVVPDLVRLPGVLERREVFFIDALQLLPHPVARVALLREHVVEHNVGLDNRLAPLARTRALKERLDMLPARMERTPLFSGRDEGAVVLRLALPKLEEANGRVDDEKEGEDRKRIADIDDPEPEVREEGIEPARVEGAVAGAAQALVDEAEKIFRVRLEPRLHMRLVYRLERASRGEKDVFSPIRRGEMDAGRKLLPFPLDRAHRHRDSRHAGQIRGDRKNVFEIHRDGVALLAEHKSGGEGRRVRDNVALPKRRLIFAAEHRARGIGLAVIRVDVARGEHEGPEDDAAARLLSESLRARVEIVVEERGAPLCEAVTHTVEAREIRRGLGRHDDVVGSERVAA